MMSFSILDQKKRMAIALLFCVIGVTAFVLANGMHSNSTEVVIELTEAEATALQGYGGSDLFPELQLQVKPLENNYYQLTVTHAQAEVFLPRLLHGDEFFAMEKEVYDPDGQFPPIDETMLGHWKAIGERIQLELIEKNLEVDTRSILQRSRDMVRNVSQMQYEFVIRGEIRDDSGDALDGVQVKVLRRQFGVVPFGGPPPAQLFTSQLVDRFFGFRVPGAYGVRAVFEKEGYYWIDISINRSQVRDVRPGEPIVQDFEIVLIEKGQPVGGFIEILNRQAGVLLFNADGSGKAIRLDVPEPPSPMPEDRHVLVNHYRPMVQANRQFNLRVDHLRQDVMDAMEDYPHGIVLSASMNDDQTAIESRVISWEKMIRGYPQTYSTVVPARIELQMTNEDDGFVMVPFHPVDHLSIDNLMRRMREAPEDGYQNRLVIDSDCWLPYIDVNGRGHVGFYYKLGGLYGKGRLFAPPGLMNQDQFLNNPAEKAKADGVRMILQLYLQVDGTRNVASY